eukprot:1149555-Pelagomonas_calceolata.AAC.5
MISAFGSSNDTAMSGFAGGHSGGVLAGGVHREGCRRGGKALHQLAHCASCHPQFGTDFPGAIMLLSKFESGQSMDWGCWDMLGYAKKQQMAAYCLRKGRPWGQTTDWKENRSRVARAQAAGQLCPTSPSNQAARAQSLSDSV